jgi:hypothetical protein
LPAGALVRALVVSRRLVATFFPTSFVGFPFVLQSTPPAPDHWTRWILAAIATVIPEHAVAKFKFRADRSTWMQAPGTVRTLARFRQMVGRSVSGLGALLNASDRRRPVCAASARIATQASCAAGRRHRRNAQGRDRHAPQSAAQRVNSTRAQSPQQLRSRARQHDGLKIFRARNRSAVSAPWPVGMVRKRGFEPPPGCPD